MIDEGVMNGTYVETTDNTLKELSRFQDFLFRNFDMQIMICNLIAINQHVFMEQLKYTI